MTAASKQRSYIGCFFILW